MGLELPFGDRRRPGIERAFHRAVHPSHGNADAAGVQVQHMGGIVTVRGDDVVLWFLLALHHLAVVFGDEVVMLQVGIAGTTAASRPMRDRALQRHGVSPCEKPHRSGAEFFALSAKKSVAPGE